MKDLIENNQFEALKEQLQSEGSDFKIHTVLAKVLDDRSVADEEYGFEADLYQEEFLEGLDLYRALVKSAIPNNQLREYTLALSFVAHKMGAFIRHLAGVTMRKGLYLSQVESAYKVNPALRTALQEFIDLLKTKNEKGAIANVSATKAQISTSISNLLEKHEIGRDMLQFAKAYEDVGETAQAANMYKGIMNDFECESLKLSSGVFPEIKQVDTRSAEEIEIFEIARGRYETLTGEKVTATETVNVNADEAAKQLVDAADKAAAALDEKNKDEETGGFFKRVRKFFK
jgi:hypothetical protein